MTLTGTNLHFCSPVLRYMVLVCGNLCQIALNTSLFSVEHILPEVFRLFVMV